MIKITKPNMLKDSLHNLDMCNTQKVNSDIQRESNRAQLYGRGILVGIVSCLMAQGMTFDEALTEALKYSDPNTLDTMCIPESWRKR